MLKKNRVMNCKEFTRLMPVWLNEDLHGKKANQFLDHINKCDECREELHIQYLVIEGTARLENASSFNLDEELAAKVNRYKIRLKREHFLNVAIYWLEAIALVAVIFILILVFYFN